MENNGLDPKILDKIKRDPILFGKVANALCVAPTTLPRLLSANDAKLTQAKVLIVLREHLGVQDNALLPFLQEA